MHDEDDERPPSPSRPSAAPAGPAPGARLGPPPLAGAGSLPVGSRPDWSAPGPAAAYQPAPPTLDARRNGFAVAALVCGLVWVFWIGSVLAVIFGHVALHQIRDAHGWERGRGPALAGLLLGYLGLALLVISIVASIVSR
jgi:hypothetical protein